MDCVDSGCDFVVNIDDFSIKRISCYIIYSMDNELREHDPYNEMKRSDISPNLPGNKSREDEKKAQQKRDEESAKTELKDAESGASGGLYKNDASAKEQEENAGGFRSLVGGKGGKKKGLMGGKFKFAKASAAAVVMMIVALFTVVVVVINTPIFTIGHLDFNLMDVLGFTKTSGILQKAATRIIEKKLSKGEMPAGLTGDLAEHGIDVGQVTASGDFVRTNVYVADVDKLKDLAVVGHVSAVPSDGELAILYDGEVIKAGDFVATVESNLKMFADYTEALDISAKYYYSNEVDQIYKEMGLSRSLFADWKDTGDAEKNKEKFEKEIEKALDNKSDLVMAAFDEDSAETTNGSINNNGVLIGPAPTTDVKPDDIYVDPATGKPYDSTTGRPIDTTNTQDTTDVTGDSDTTDTSDDTSNQGSYRETTVSNSEDASEIVDNVAATVTGSDATSKAAQLLNAAISAGEPYLAASMFVGIESPIQQARIEGTGPVNELMNLLNAETEVSYTNVLTGETEAKKQSILTTGNFVAAVSGGKFSTNEAANFARDRALIATNMNDYGIINNTSVKTDGQEKSDILMPVGSGDSADNGALRILDDSVAMAMVESNYSLMTSQVGGNRIVEGGSFLSNTINSHVIGAMPSDADTIAAYNREAKTEVARMAAAERATKSPFDISSQYTFMGSIVHGFANAMIQNGRSGGMISNSVGSFANLTGDSVKGIWGSVMADGEDDTDYGTTFGDYCDTVKSISVEGDIYCTSHNTISTAYMDYSEDDWKNALGSSLDENGIVEKSKLADFEMMAMDRWSTVGVENASVCERYRDMHDNIFKKIAAGFKDWIGIYKVCDGIEDVGTGSAYTFSGDSDDARLYGGYMLYDEVSSLLDGTVSKATAFREKYYKEHPLDDSRAGKIARISGMTKAEAGVALAYADYLTFIARYNPAEQYAFGIDFSLDRPVEPLVEHANQVAVDLYIMWHGRTEYDDLRSRTRVA